MNKDFSTKETKATFFCLNHNGDFTIIGKDKYYYVSLAKV